MTGESPTIVHGQHTRYMLFADILQQHPHIYIMIVNIVHMDNIRLHFIYPLQQPLGFSLIVKSMMTRGLCPKFTNEKLSIRFYPINSILFIILWIIAKTKSYITFNPISFITFFKSKVIRPVDPPL